LANFFALDSHEITRKVYFELTIQAVPYQLAATQITYWPSNSIDQVQAPNKPEEIYGLFITNKLSGVLS